MTAACLSAGYRAYVGCRTTAERNARGQGITMFQVSPQGVWSERHTTAAGANPSFLCLHPGGRMLYAVHGDGDAVSAFAVEAADGRLRPQGTHPVDGRNPVHLCLSPNVRWLLVACYATGSVSSLAVREDGRLGPIASRLALPGEPGPVAAQQQGSHPHQVVFDPTGRWLLVPDKGTDRLHTITLDEATGALAWVSCAALPPGSGPRHLAFTRDGRRLYLACELGSAAAACNFDARTGTPTSVASWSTLAEAVPGNTAAGIVLSDDERTLYVSNRGHDSIATFRVDPVSGRLAPSGWLPSGGSTPRFIAGDPIGGVLVANEDSDALCRVAGTAAPSPLARTGSPVCVVFTKDLS